MHKKEFKIWKKARTNDYPYIVNEIKTEVVLPAIIFLEGPMGIGKTTFTQYFTEDNISSPTYSILTDYSEIVHADFYRLKSSEELYELELSMYLEEKSYFLAEWGLQYFNSLFSSHIPEGFNYYLLELKSVEGNNEERDLVFYEIDPLLS